MGEEALRKETAEVELELKKVELSEKRLSIGRSRWNNPLVIAILAAALAGVSNAIVAIINGNGQIALEDRKSEQSRILEMLKTGDPDKAAANLTFLIEAGLLTDTTLIANLRAYLKNRSPGQGPALAATTPITGNPANVGICNEIVRASLFDGSSQAKVDRKQFFQQSHDEMLANYGKLFSDSLKSAYETCTLSLAQYPTIRVDESSRVDWLPGNPGDTNGRQFPHYRLSLTFAWKPSAARPNSTTQAHVKVSVPEQVIDSRASWGEAFNPQSDAKIVPETLQTVTSDVVISVQDISYTTTLDQAGTLTLVFPARQR